MTVRHEIETLSFTFLASMVATCAIILLHKSPAPQKLYVTIALPQVFSTVTPTPTPTLLPDITYSSQTSSDGNEKISMKTVDIQGMKTYTFTLTDVTTNTNTPLFTQQVATASSMSIPFNAFSPGNTYVFITQKDPDASHFLVFKTSGESFGNGSVYIDATTAFESYTSTYSHPQATGWGDDGLLIINAVSTDNHPASFWMQMPGGSFIPLSNYFP